MHLKLLSVAFLLAVVPALAESTEAKWTFDVRELSLSYSNTCRDKVTGVVSDDNDGARIHR